MKLVRIMLISSILIITILLICSCGKSYITTWDIYPLNNSTGIPVDCILKWQMYFQDTTSYSTDVKYLVFLSKTPELNTPVASGITENEYDPGILDGDTTYYWKVVALYNGKRCESPTWIFKTDNGIPSEIEISEFRKIELNLKDYLRSGNWSIELLKGPGEIHNYVYEYIPELNDFGNYEVIFKIVKKSTVVNLAIKIDVQPALHVSIKATQEDMRNGCFKVVFEEINNPGKRTLFFWNNSEGAEALDPFNQDGTFYKTMSGDNELYINYSFFPNATKVIYGYTVCPIERVPGSGFCNEDVCILDLYNDFPQNIYEEMEQDIGIMRFDIPEGMEIYTPFPRFSNSIYIIMDKKNEKLKYLRLWLSMLTWGNYDSVEIKDYGYNKLYMLTYKTDTSNVFRLAEFSYDYFINIFNNSNLSYFLPDCNIVAIFPENWKYYSRGEGLGGFYNPNWQGNEWEPRDEYNGYTISNTYFSHFKNISGITINGVHCIAHTLIAHNIFPDWWFVEGIAVYYQRYMAKKIGILNEDQYLTEWKEEIRVYNDEIVGKDRDHVLKGIGVKYNIDDHDLEMWIAYNKSALVFFIINHIVNEKTGKELIDFLKYHVENLTNPRENTYEKFIENLSNYTGMDFESFFRKFIYDKQPLPIQLSNGEIIIQNNW